MKLPVETIRAFADPFESFVWLDMEAPLRREEVSDALGAGKTWDKPIDPSFSTPAGREQHVQRVAHLVAHGWADPICVEFGYGWPIQDGNHRLAAAIYRGDAEIDVEFGGFLADIEISLGNKVAAAVEAEWDKAKVLDSSS